MPRSISEYFTWFATIGAGGGPADPPAGVVRDARVAHLAGTHRVVERAEGLLERHRVVDGVHVPEVDVVGAELAQRVVEAAQQRAAGRVDLPALVGAHDARLGGDDQVDPRHHVGDQPAEDHL
jgi:hypothetical protein